MTWAYNMKRILFINSVYGTKSTGRICFNLCESLKKKGFEAKTLYSREQNNKANGFFVGKKIIVTLNAASARLFDNDGRFDTHITDKIISYIKYFKPDIVHIHNLHGYYANIKKLFNFLQTTDITIFITLHDSWLYTGHCCYYLYNHCYEWQKGCFKCRFKRNYPASFLFSRSKRNLKNKIECFETLTNKVVLITPSDWLRKEVNKTFLNKYPIHVINNGINLKQFSSRVSKTVSEQKTILAINAVWDERKNLAFFAKLDSCLPDSYSIIVVGKIKNNQKKYLKNTRIQHVEFIESTEQLAHLYSSASFFVNPTLEDNYPTTSLESISCGTPVIALDVGGVKETIPSGCGFFGKDEDELIDFILNKKPFRISLDDKLRYFLSFERQIDEYLELYEKYN